ncbi:MAG: SPASM domain-containing protein, partial [Candidatus Omnitrophica bacterium]|nr:SPASM domain-containing protein [Candidatus Omnitrophota bacterium]
LTLLNSLKRDVPRVNIYNVVSNRNYRELPEMVDFALATNSDSLEFTVIDTIPGATDALMLTEEQRAVVTAGCEEIQKRLDNELKGKIRIQQFEQFVRRVGNRDANCAQYDKNILEEMPCYIGWLFARILADGNVNFCLKAHRIPVGNIYAHSFTHIWNSRRQQEFRKRALCPGKDDAFFSFIGNDPAAKVGCFKSCDDLARNVHMHKKIQSLTLPEIIMLKLLLVLKKIQRHVRGKTFTRAFCETVKKRDALGGKELRCRNLRVVPHSEGIRLVWNDQELTHSVGLNTSVCIFGLWYDSSKAEWEIVRQGEQEIILKNTWRNIPLSQQWHLVLDDEHTVRWRIDMLIDSKLEIEQMKTSVMLPAGYKHWSAGNQRGKFSALMAWNDMSLADATVRRIGVPGIQLKGRPVPGVCLDFSESGADTVMPQIQNSDKNINARVLSACRRVPETAAVMVPGTYPVFSGKIIISADKD